MLSKHLNIEHRKERDERHISDAHSLHQLLLGAVVDVHVLVAHILARLTLDIDEIATEVAGNENVIQQVVDVGHVYVDTVCFLQVLLLADLEQQLQSGQLLNLQVVKDARPGGLVHLLMAELFHVPLEFVLEASDKVINQISSHEFLAHSIKHSEVLSMRSLRRRIAQDD